MRLLLVIQSLGAGGAERQVAALATGLRRRGHAVSLAVLRRGDGPLAASVEADGVQLHVLTAPPRKGLLAAATQLTRIARDERTELVHGYMPVGNLLALGVGSVRPSVRVVFGMRSSRLDWRHYPMRTRVTEWLSHRLAVRADLIIANSETTAAYCVAAGSPASRTVVVPNGIDTLRFAADAASGERLRAALGLRATDPVIGIVARLDPMKDHRTFLRAAQRLLLVFPTARFLCVGGGADGYRRELEALADSLEVSHAVRWLGERQDTVALLNTMDVATQTSLFGEGFPNAVGEAMACERACVVTDVGDAGRIVGATGVVVPPGNAVALADGWARVLREGGRELGARARRRVEEHYSLPRMIEHTEDLLLTVLRHARLDFVAA